MRTHPTMYEVTAHEGTLCRNAGLEVKPYGRLAHVIVYDGKQRETFWAQRLAFLRANSAN